MTIDQHDLARRLRCLANQSDSDRAEEIRELAVIVDTESDVDGLARWLADATGRDRVADLPSAAKGFAPAPEPLRAAAFHGLAGEFVRAVDPHTEADPAAMLTQFLAAFGNACGRG